MLGRDQFNRARGIEARVTPATFAEAAAEGRELSVKVLPEYHGSDPVPVRRRLLELVPPPSRPPAAVDWAAARRALGVESPDGYRWLAETYGPGPGDLPSVFESQPRRDTRATGLLPFADSMHALSM